MLSRDQSLQICEQVLARAKAAGAEDAVVSVQGQNESHLRFAANHVTTSGRSNDVEIAVTVWVGGRRGTATGNDVSPAAVEPLASEAIQIARVSPLHREYVPTLGPLTYSDERAFAATTADVDLAARARAVSAVLDNCRAGKITGAGFHTAHASSIGVATANGNRRYFRTSEGAFSVTARSGDGTGSGYYAGDHFDLAQLDVQRIGREAVGKAVRSQRPQPIEPGVYPVILEPQAVSDLLGFLVNAFDARTVDEGRGALSAKGGKARVGEALFNDRISIYSDPMHSEMPAMPATAEGVPASRFPLITSGVVANLQYSRFWAREQKRDPSPGPVNYIFESSQPPTPLPSMIESMERGLLVSRFWYVRLVDPRTLMLTGLTRDGLWWIEKGRIRNAVGNLRFNQSVLAMLAPWNVDAIGAPERRSPWMVPALKLSGFTFTSVSDAI